jgi:putative Mn2+ efflux pump MntP
MSLLSLIAIAVGLSMDAFAASITSGLTLPRMRLRHALLITSFFGTFQALMPLLGWSVGHWSRSFISAIDHWIAFSLLTVIGGKMLFAALEVPL